jgi:hypothetical protein
MICWVKGTKPGKASVKRKCEPEEVQNVIKNHLLAKNSKNFDQKRYLI